MVVSRKDFPKLMELGNAWTQHWSQKKRYCYKKINCFLYKDNYAFNGSFIHSHFRYKSSNSCL